MHKIARRIFFFFSFVTPPDHRQFSPPAKAKIPLPSYSKGIRLNLGGRANLRAAALIGDLSVAGNKDANYGRRSFAVSGTRTLNMLSPLTRKRSLSFGQLRSRLQTELFTRAY